MRKKIVITIIAVVASGFLYSAILTRLGNKYSLQSRSSCETNIGYFNHGDEWLGQDGCSECYCVNGLVDCRDNKCGKSETLSN
ncbi:hypothetical protein GF357_03170 [Candidatus Dojkabacteria bacterium]|nr:hypothetical protein [Candidatus Dojkabacteria bacterium]